MKKMGKMLKMYNPIIGDENKFEMHRSLTYAFGGKRNPEYKIFLLHNSYCIETNILAASLSDSELRSHWLRLLRSQ